jgi:hypothetical protein
MIDKIGTTLLACVLVLAASQAYALNCRPNPAGGMDYSNGVSSRPNPVGGMDYSNGINCRTNPVGGVYCQ